MEFSFDNFAKEGLHEECGVFGIFSDGTINPAYACYNGLLALQHRGQESCGIAVSDEGVIDYHKDMGLVTEVFNNKILDSLNGQMAVSHVRYSTAGGSVLENAQPLVMRYVKGTLSIAHNGNLTNALEIRRSLEQRGAIFQTTIDSEVICYVIARERLKCHSVEDAVARTMQVIEGAYSLLVMSPRKLIAARDPHGFRPLCMGKYNDSYVFASESAALDACGAEFVRDVEPGEIVIVDQNGVRSMKPDFGDKKKALCIFEYIYFARSDSFIDGVSVYEARKQAGRILARKYPVEADMVVGVPESGIDAAIGYSEEDEPRMVKTPWSNEAIPFDDAAEIGTKKVITDHSTIGLVITTDGTISDIPREDYIESEKRVINELKAINKPFIYFSIQLHLRQMKQFACQTK